MSKPETATTPDGTLPDGRSSTFKAPTWALAAAVVLILGAIAIYFIRQNNRIPNAIEALNAVKFRNLEGKDVQLDGLQDTFEIASNDHLNGPTFGEMRFDEGKDSGRLELLDVLGQCTREPEVAKEIFHKLITDGTTGGKIVACHMAFFLAQGGNLSREDLDGIAKCLDTSAEPTLRRKAQWALTRLVVSLDPSKRSVFIKLPEKPDVVKSGWRVATQDLKNYGVPYLRFMWSDPDACKAWWDTFGKSAAWNKEQARFVVTPVAP